jgi:putative transposase
MARLARLVLPGCPHHVTQRGNRREQTFFRDSDYTFYRELLAEAAEKAGTQIWCYCLMPNHVHMIVVPADEQGLHRTFSEAHRRYTSFINARHGWTGHLWQGRFKSVVMDETHLAHAMRYVSLNPVRARLVATAQDWPWSSVRAHLARVDDRLVRVAPAIERYGDFALFLGDHGSETDAWQAIRRSEGSGRPLGSAAWLAGLEAQTGRRLAPQKRGRKPAEISKLSPK